MKNAQSKKPKKQCCICGKLFVMTSHRSEYCRVCSQLSKRMSTEHFPAKTRKRIWNYIRKNGYVCYYTQMPLDTYNPKSPWYVVFDHWIPGNNKKVVLTSALLNDMKSDLSEKEFWYFIDQLANYKKKRLEVKKKRLVYWYRLNP
jgi:hypothetical protein